MQPRLPPEHRVLEVAAEHRQVRLPLVAAVNKQQGAGVTLNEELQVLDR